MIITAESKEIIIKDVLRILNLKTPHKGCSHFKSILLKAWISLNDDWTKYENYISMIASENEKPVKYIGEQINTYIRYICRQNNNEIFKCIFDCSPDAIDIPTWTFFARTMLSIFFYCERNDVDIITLISNLENPEYDTEKYNAKVLSGYLILLLKQIGLPETVVDKSTQYIDNIVQNNSFGSAFIAYIKHTSAFFSDVSFDGIVIPPEYYNISIYDLLYDDDKLGVKIANIFIRNGISYLIDLRFKSNEDIQRFRGLGINLYGHFADALKKTVES